MKSSEILSGKLERALITLDQEAAERIIFDASSKHSLLEIAGITVTEALTKIGEAWETGSVSLSQVYMSGIICERIFDKLLPSKSSVRKDQPKMAIAVFEDYHLLGKRIIHSTLRASGYELMDLGGGQTCDSLVNIVKKEKIEVLLLSVLMLPSALRVKELRDQLYPTGVKIIVGGAPFRLDDKLWMEIGVDGYGNDSSDALKIVNKIVG